MDKMVYNYTEDSNAELTGLYEIYFNLIVSFFKI